MNKRPPTLKDVALRAGTSKMAVSAVLNGTKSTVGVSESVRQRILQALDELQYRPDVMARSLRSDRIGLVGFYCSAGYIDTRDPWMRALFHGLTSGLAAKERELLIYNALFGRRREEAVRRMLSNKVDALIVLPSPDDADLTEAMANAHVRAVTLVEPLGDLPLVCADDRGGAAAMARYLIGAGHRRILYRRAATHYRYEAARFEAFQETASALGAEVIAAEAQDQRDSVTEGEQALLLNRREREGITAVACWRDYSAVRLLNFCAMNGIQVPGDIAVAGFDGVRHTGLPAGAHLTTIDADWTAVSRTAADIVATLLSGPPPPAQTLLPAVLHLGNTA